MAKLLRHFDEDESLQQLTREGIAVGTPRYIAPEQARGLEVGPWTDLYALGLLMYEMLTGAQAVKADDVQGAVSAHVSRDPLELDEIDDVPEAFRPVLHRLIDKDPEQRYRSADALLDDLEALSLQTGGGLASPGHPGLDPRKGRIDGALAGRDIARSSDGPSDEQRRRAQQIAAREQADESLELDYEAYDRHAPKEKDPAIAARRARDKPFFRMPDSGWEWLEAAAAPLVGFFAFVILTAQLRSFSYEVRLGIGLAPVVCALLWTLLAGEKSWRNSFFRLWNLFSLAALFIGHAIGPERLITSLYRHSTWFLAPVSDLPGMHTVDAVLMWVIRRYAMVLSTVLDAAFDVIY